LLKPPRPTDMAAKIQDKIICGVALVVLLASLGWMLSQKGKHDAMHRASRESITVAPYEPTNLRDYQANSPMWFAPPAQSSGAEWTYDVFTPPEIYYDASSNRFSVSVPTLPKKEVIVEQPFGVALVQVKQDAFRLQLVGYVGAEGNYRGTFENVLAGKTILGRAGKKIADLGLTIKSFEVKRNVVKQAVGTSLVDFEATAEVVDDETGEVFNLTNKNRLSKGTPIAVLHVDGVAEDVPYKAGATFNVGDAHYTISSVTTEPAEVVVVKESPSLKEPVTKTLTPITPAPSDATTNPVEPVTKP
jgi:hypothetical protein